jgi:hypothetical protein
MIVSCSAASPHEPAHVFENLRDTARHPEWAPDTEYVTRDGPFAAGTTGLMKLTGGPKLRFVMRTVEEGREYTDVTRMPGARIVFEHLIEPVDGSGSRLTAVVSIEGPLGWLWTRILGPGFRKTVPADLQRLAAL